MNNITKSKLNPFNFFGVLKFRNKSLLYTLLGATFIVTGGVLKNTTEQMKEAEHPLHKVGTALCLLGWIVIAFAVAESGRHTMLKNVLDFGSVAGIIYSMMAIKKMKNEGQEVPKLHQMLLIGSWLLLGYTVGMGWGGGLFNYHRIFGLGAAVMALISVMYMLPWQRALGLVDGPGVPVYVGAWILLTFGNSLLPN